MGAVSSEDRALLEKLPDIKLRKTARPTAEQRFEARYVIDPVSGCYLWMGKPSLAGYGQHSINGKPVRAHRYSYERSKGAIPAGMNVLHSVGCVSRLCVNPAHLRIGTHKDNAEDSQLAGTRPTGPGSKPRKFKSGADTAEAFGMKIMGATSVEVAERFGAGLDAVKAVFAGKTGQKALAAELDRRLEREGPTPPPSAEELARAETGSPVKRRKPRKGQWDALD